MRRSWLFIITVIVLLDRSYGSPCKTHENHYGCKYWCKTHDNHYYCCPSGYPEQSELEEKWFPTNFWVHIIGSMMNWYSHKHKEHDESGHETPKLHCPPMRSLCPRLWRFDGPIPCHSDETCGLWEKCCYDICLDQTVCKPVE